MHTPFVDKFLKQHFPGKEAEVFEKLSNSQPIGRMGSPKEIADLALYLCSDESSFITGTDFPIDGGFIKSAHDVSIGGIITAVAKMCIKGHKGINCFIVEKEMMGFIFVIWTGLASRKTESTTLIGFYIFG